MGRPDDIPEWAWEKADAVLSTTPNNWDARKSGIARAILAAVEEENEACALVALRFEDGIDAAEHIRRRNRNRS